MTAPKWNWYPKACYQLCICGVKDAVSHAGNQMTVVQIKVEDNLAIFPHYILHPADGLPVDEKRRRSLRIKQFVMCFGVHHNSEGIDTDDFWGATARCEVIKEMDTHGTICNRLLLPKLRREET